MKSVLRRALTGLTLVMLLGPVATAAEMSQTERGRIEQIVRDYLLQNPELLLEVMEKLEQKQQAAARDDAAQRIQSHKAALFQSTGDFVVNDAGTVPVVEFFDYQCGYCKRILPAVVRLIDENTAVRFIYKEFPILGEMSTLASRAAIAAKRQGKYQDYHNALMALRRPLSEDVIYEVAGEVGLDVGRLKRDMDSPEVSAVIDGNRALGQALGLRGTPSMVIGDVLIPGAIGYERMVGLVAQMQDGCSVC